RLVKPRYVGLIYTLEPVAALIAGVFAGSQELTLLIAAGAVCTTAAAVISVFLSLHDGKEPATGDSLNETKRTTMTKNTTPAGKAAPGPLVAAIIAFLGAATAAINLWIENADKDERLRKHDDTIGKNADTLQSQQKTIEIFTERGLTPAGTFDDTLVASLADFLGAEARRRPAHLTIITDTAMYGCLSYPAEFSRMLNQIESLAKDVNGSKTGVKMLVYSDARMREVLDLQFPESKWREKVAGKTKGLPEKLTTWVNLPDVKKSLPKEPPAMLEKTANFMAGKFAPEDRAEFISCLLNYNKHLQARFSEMGVKIYLCDSPLPFHLWLSDKADKDETVTGIISIADWISSINEPGFHIRRLTHGQFSAIADQLLESAKPFS
ncbi:MAG TPA: hypothetical protein VHM91_00320, partial [Verrucomicrobiales bacterium]|nr:hypothetical protein [Verrucomicrobiales bacterium]